MSYPSSEAHERLMRSAYNDAGITDLTKTAMVECHGSMTIPVSIWKSQAPFKISMPAVFGGP
jgi:hypothetical protein